MCGICGKLSFNGKPVDERLLWEMTSVMTHRGPDDDGIFHRWNGRFGIGLGQRRLSIIDLSEAGRQPMTNEDRTIWLVFNGEIYNFKELREELEKKGHQFHSHSDSEVILHLYEEEGRELAKRLNGMFAFAIWDQRRETLLLCRDRIGIKPLVYAFDGESLVFGSEIKSILQDHSVRKEIDWQALDLYLTFNYVPAPYTIFKTIRKVRPGHYLLFGNGQIREESYWDIPAQGVEDGIPADDIEGQKKAVYQALEESVRGHMIADVPVAAFLSGGIDSSIVVGLMARNSSRPVKTYSIGYTGIPMYDETAFARDVAKFNATEHHEIKLSAEDMIEAVPLVLAALDEPFADSSAVPTYVVSRETAKDVKVALSGDGGDELFAGYRMYTGEQWYSLYLMVPELFRTTMNTLISYLPDSRDHKILEHIRRMKKFIRGARGSFEERFFAWNEIFSRDLRESILAISNGIDRDLGKKRLTDRLREKDFDNINRMLYADVKESLPGDMLQKVDTMSMLNSLEVRVPILDHRVCEAAFQIRGDLKIRGGRGKHIFIEAFKGILPRSLHRRPKWGFEMPVSRWLKGELKYLIDEYLSEERISKQAIFHYPIVRGLVTEHLSGRSDRSWLIWNLIVFQAWYSNYFEGGRI
jgi:asparagine synthase (glutamine-hydrolysing)